jgi:hypothetical protein
MNSIYRYAPLSTTALRQLVCALEGAVILQFWLASPVVRAAVWRGLQAAAVAAGRLHVDTHSPRGVWLLMGGVIVLAFGSLLLLRWLLPTVRVPETTEADVRRLLDALDESVHTEVETV